MHAADRPDYSPENRSPTAGKVIAITTLTLLVLGALATIAVVLNRGRSGIQTPPQIIDPSGGYNRAGAPANAPADAGAASPARQ